MRLSKFISIILHPIFMPILAFYLSLKQVPSIGLAITNNQNYIYLVSFISTVILPNLSRHIKNKNKPLPKENSI